MEERRSARTGTVSGLALLAGGTAVAAVAGGSHSAFATILLGLLTVGLGHALIVEIRRQARRRAPGGWGRTDTVNAVLLACWAEAALVLTIVAGPLPLRLVGGGLAAAYAGSCGFFVTERRRAVAADADTPLPARVPAEPGP